MDAKRLWCLFARFRVNTLYAAEYCLSQHGARKGAQWLVTVLSAITIILLQFLSKSDFLVCCLRNLKSQHLNFKSFKLKHVGLISAANTEQQSGSTSLAPHRTGHICSSKATTKGLKLFLVFLLHQFYPKRQQNLQTHACLEGQQEKQFPLPVVSTTVLLKKEKPVWSTQKAELTWNFKGSRCMWASRQRAWMQTVYFLSFPLFGYNFCIKAATKIQCECNRGTRKHGPSLITGQQLLERGILGWCCSLASQEQRSQVNPWLAHGNQKRTNTWDNGDHLQQPSQETSAGAETRQGTFIAMPIPTGHLVLH